MQYEQNTNEHKSFVQKKLFLFNEEYNEYENSDDDYNKVILPLFIAYISHLYIASL